MYLQDSSQEWNTPSSPQGGDRTTPREAALPALSSSPLGPPVSLSPECGPQLHPSCGLWSRPLPNMQPHQAPFRIVTQSVWGQWVLGFGPSVGKHSALEVKLSVDRVPCTLDSPGCLRPAGASRGAELGRATKSRLHRAHPLCSLFLCRDPGQQTRLCCVRILISLKQAPWHSSERQPRGGPALLLAADVRGPGVSGHSAEPSNSGEGNFLTPCPGFPRTSLLLHLNPRLLKTLTWFLFLHGTLTPTNVNSKSDLGSTTA